MYLVDTNIVSEARRGTQQAVSWLRSVDPLSIQMSAQKSDPKAAVPDLRAVTVLIQLSATT
jgi:predicted nucleic acid-binding protein